MDITIGNSPSPSMDSFARRNGGSQGFENVNIDRFGVRPDITWEIPSQDRQGRDTRGTARADGESGEDTLELSREARRMAGMIDTDGADRSGVERSVAEPEMLGQRGNVEEDDAQKTDQPNDGREDSVELSPEAQKMVEDLKARDKEVRAHEAAHIAAGAGIVNGGAQFTTQRGPDGVMYAVGGEVSIDAGEVPNDPKATIAKARQIVAAALAPADPSPQDRTVAAQAGQMQARASAELARQQTEENEPTEKIGQPDQAEKAGRPNQDQGIQNAQSDQANVTNQTRRREANTQSDANRPGSPSDIRSFDIRQDQAVQARQAVSAYGSYGAQGRDFLNGLVATYQTVA